MGSEGGSNKENREPVQSLHPRDFCSIHRYARVACVFWHAHNCFPDGLAGLSGDILIVANQKLIPEYASDIDEHVPVDWAGLYLALQEHKEELAGFTEHQQNQTLLPSARQ